MEYYYDAFIRELVEGKIKDHRPVEGQELLEEFTARLADLSPRDVCRLFASWLSSHELLKETRRMNPICFYHRADFDGVCSAAIVKKFVPDCELYGIDYGDPFPWDKVMDGPQVSAAELEAGSGLPRRQVYMVDFSLPPGEMKRLAEVSDLVWIDHHWSAIDSYNASLGFGCPHECLLQTDWSACELCWYWFDGADLDDPDKWLPEAVRLLGRYDVWDAKNPDWPRIEAFQFGMRAEAGAMSPIDPVWTSLLDPRPDENPDEVSLLDIEMRGRAILSYRDQEAKSLCADGAYEALLGDPNRPGLELAIAKAEKNGQPVSYNCPGFRLICLNSLSRGSWQFNSVWDPEKYDAMCVYGRLKNGKYRVSLYSTKEEVDCGALCKALGGGGHKGAAGFLCDKLPWEGV